MTVKTGLKGRYKIPTNILQVTHMWVHLLVGWAHIPEQRQAIIRANAGILLIRTSEEHCDH